MKITLSSLAFILVCLLACENPKNQKPKNDKPINYVKPINADDTVKSFLPVTEILKGAISENNNYITPRFIDVKNKPNDTVYIKDLNFIKKFCVEFLKDEITATNMVPFFKQTSFVDGTTKQAIFSYTRRTDTIIPKDLNILSWDLSVDSLGNVSRIYLVKKAINGKQYECTWQKDEYILNRLNEVKDGLRTQVLSEEKLLLGY